MAMLELQAAGLWIMCPCWGRGIALIVPRRLELTEPAMWWTANGISTAARGTSKTAQGVTLDRLGSETAVFSLNPRTIDRRRVW